MNEELKELRKESGETQAQLAKLLGLKTASAYCKKEKGNIPLSAQEIKTLAEHYNKPVSFFYQ
jgi:transcriptional regulator with XRE-family HTH domain